MENSISPFRRREPWNKGRMIGQKRPLKPKDVWTIRVRLQLEGRKRDLAMFNLAVDSKLRGCDLVRLKIDDVSTGGRVRDRATVIQKKTGRPVQFEIAVGEWLGATDAREGRYLFPSRFRGKPHLSTRQYARIVHRWTDRAGLDSAAYGTHSLRRTKPTQIYKKTGNLRALQLLLGLRSWRAPCAISGSRLMTRSASRSRSNFSRAGVCGPAKSRGRSPIRVDRGHHPVGYPLLARSRWRPPSGDRVGW
jgi:hypothetical protein